MPNATTRLNVANATSRYNEKYSDLILPTEYMAELEYLYEVFKVKPNQSLYQSAVTQTRSSGHAR